MDEIDPLETDADANDCHPSGLRSALTEAQARRLAERFAALSDPSRLRLLDILGRHGRKVCVCELVEALPLSQPTISHHLRSLRAAGLVDYEKHGVWAYYYVRPETVIELRSHLEALARQPAPALAGCECASPQVNAKG